METNVKLTKSEIEDLEYSIKQIDNYLARKESNLMSMIYPNWNKVKEYLNMLIDDCHYHLGDI